MRVPIFAANWKMHKNVAEAVAFAEKFRPLLEGHEGSEVVIAPPFPALDALGRALAGSDVALAAQARRGDREHRKHRKTGSADTRRAVDALERRVGGIVSGGSEGRGVRESAHRSGGPPEIR